MAKVHPACGNYDFAIAILRIEISSNPILTRHYHQYPTLSPILTSSSLSLQPSTLSFIYDAITITLLMTGLCNIRMLLSEQRCCTLKVYSVFSNIHIPELSADSGFSWQRYDHESSRWDQTRLVLPQDSAFTDWKKTKIGICSTWHACVLWRHSTSYLTSWAAVLKTDWTIVSIVTHYLVIHCFIYLSSCKWRCCISDTWSHWFLHRTEVRNSN